MLEDDRLGLLDHLDALHDDRRGTHDHGVERGRDEIVVANLHTGLCQGIADLRREGRQADLVAVGDDRELGRERDLDDVTVVDGGEDRRLDLGAVGEQAGHVGFAQDAADRRHRCRDAASDTAIDVDLDRDGPFDVDRHAVLDGHIQCGGHLIGGPHLDVQAVEHVTDGAGEGPQFVDLAVDGDLDVG